jgi:hypothetical protein
MYFNKGVILKLLYSLIHLIWLNYILTFLKGLYESHDCVNFLENDVLKLLNYNPDMVAVLTAGSADLNLWQLVMLHCLKSP